MVGVPGRSTGCNTCRRRKVKCGESAQVAASRLERHGDPPQESWNLHGTIADSFEDETKPTCQRCVKAGFQCLGYARETIWHHTMYSSLAKTNPEDRQGMDSPPNELSLVAFQGDFCKAYLFSNFVWRTYGIGWLDQAARGNLGGLALDASTALAEVTFGRENHQAGIEIKGRATYGICLRTLAGEMGKGGSSLARRGQELLVPILVLLMHASANTDRAGAVFHLKAIAGLLYMCGPESFQRQPLLNAFEACRATLVSLSRMLLLST